ncbi:MAG: nucleotidyltransferase family protein [Bacteroidota bacterium]
MIGIILLAAGPSSRMGQSKQLLEIAGEQLLLKATRIALQSEVERVVVVLGANESTHRKVIEQLPIEIITNVDWQRGMGSSLKKGLTELRNIIPQLEAAVVMVCDQPLLTTQHLNNLIRNFKQTKNLIVASYYSGTAGVPALFEKSLFEKLLTVDDDSGAKKIIQQHKNLVQTLDFPSGAIDLDTLDDYRKFIK